MGFGKRLARAIVPRWVRNWLRNPGRAVRWAWCDLLARLGSTQVLEIRPGWRLRSHPGAFAFAYRAQVDDPAQVAEFDQFICHCTQGMVLFDIGTHFGLFSLAAAHYGGPAAQAVAVDPAPLAARIVQFQARVNGYDNRVRMVQAAAGNMTGHDSLVAAGIGSSGYYVRPQHGHTVSEQTQVSVVSIDGLRNNTGLQPTHVKIDVEGCEAAVLRGGVDTLTGRNPPVIFLELHTEMIREVGGDVAECPNLLAEWGYAFRDAHGNLLHNNEILVQPLVRLIATRSIHAAIAVGEGKP
jgi:FkbM family methyltransferase